MLIFTLNSKIITSALDLTHNQDVQCPTCQYTIVILFSTDKNILMAVIINSVKLN